MMNKEISKVQEVKQFLFFLISYFKSKVVLFAFKFERSKNWLVSKLLWRRGTLNRPALHFGMILLAAVGLAASGAIGGSSIVSGSYPGISNPLLTSVTAPPPDILGSAISAQTIISDKPRSEIITYKVQKGDTLSSIAQKFNIDVDTIKWANTLSDIHSLSIGQELKIMPVSGVAHTVKSGDTVYSIAKTYGIEAQPIVDFPFNDVGEDLALKIGQVLIIPDGQPPTPAAPPKPKYYAQTPSISMPSTSGQFIWPVAGAFTQYFSWWHPAIDVANSAAPNIVAADSGRVIVAGWPDNQGYGNRVIVDHGNGYTTLYGHLSRIDVSVGQNVARGEVIGRMGSTGRSTGTHLHLEIRKNGVAQNPLSFLR